VPTFFAQFFIFNLIILAKNKEAKSQSGEKAGMKKVKKNKYWVWIPHGPGPYWGAHWGRR